MKMAHDFVDFMPSALGLIQIEANDQGITAIRFVEQQGIDSQANLQTDLAKQQLSEYFAGSRQEFALPLAASGTAFQQAVWKALLSIGYGQTASYSDIANMLNKPNAVRAVGAANGKNPISIVVPCHRIIGKNGTLTGYAGGLDRKQKLLALEQNTH